MKTRLASPSDHDIGLADPMGAALHSFYTTGTLASEGSSISEGIGQGRITANLEGFTPDHSYQVSDEEALPIVFDLLANEGLCLAYIQHPRNKSHASFDLWYPSK